MSRMEIPLKETSVKTACRIVNEFKWKDSDTDYGYIGNPTWEFTSYSTNDHITLQIKFENWRLDRDQFENLLEFIDELDTVVEMDWYLAHDSPLIFTLQIDQDEVLGDKSQKDAEGDTAD